MTTKNLLDFVLVGRYNTSDMGTIYIDEFLSVSDAFGLQENVSVKKGTYFYIYLEDYKDVKFVESKLNQEFDYVFNLDSDGLLKSTVLGLYRIED